VLKIFYTCYSTDESIEASAARDLASDSLVDVAPRFLKDEGDFFGVIDSDKVVLQFMVESSDLIRLEMPKPQEKGALVKVIGFSQLADTLQSINEPLSKVDQEGMRFEAW